MNWIYGIRSKLKIAIVLLILIGVIVLGTFLERHYMRNIHTSSSSMYEDRLVPATEIYHLSDHLFSKYLLIEKVLMHPDKTDHREIRKQIDILNRKADSLIKDYELTYLVHMESEGLKAFKKKLKMYNRMESRILYSSVDDPETVRKIHLLFAGLRKELRALSTIQTAVGKELISGTKNMCSRSSLISNLQIAILIILCMIAQTLILAHRDTRYRNDRFRWN